MELEVLIYFVHDSSDDLQRGMTPSKLTTGPSPPSARSAPSIFRGSEQSQCDAGAHGNAHDHYVEAQDDADEETHEEEGNASEKSPSRKRVRI